MLTCCTWACAPPVRAGRGCASSRPQGQCPTVRRISRKQKLSNICGALSENDSLPSQRDPSSPDPEASQASSAHGNLRNADEAETRRVWMAAIKPPMYSVGFVPVLVATAAVFFESGVVQWLRSCGLVLSAVLIIAWLNLSNDAFDATTGVDRAKRESVVNLTGNRQLVLIVANLFLLAGVGLLGSQLMAVGDVRPALMLAVAIVCGYVYQGPPFRLSYKGLGEPLCFFAFGPLATPAFYLALQPKPVEAAGTVAAAVAPVTIPPLVWVLAACVGATTTIILFCSHFHQIEGDTAAGKMSPLVRLGTGRAFEVLKVAVALPFLAVAAVAGLGQFLSSCHAAPLPLLPALLVSLPAAKALIAFAAENHRVPAAIATLKIFATKLHMAFCVSLVLGLVASRLLLL